MNVPLLSHGDVERLGWVLIHSVWQFAVVALLSGMFLRVIRNRPPTSRYVLLVGALAISAALPLVTWSILSPHIAATPTEATFDSVMLPTAAPSVDVAPIETVAADTLSPADPADPADAPVRSGDLPAHSIVATTIPSSLATRFQTIVQPWLIWFVIAWAFGVGVCSLRPILGWRTLRRLRSVGVSPVDNDVLLTLRQLSARLGVLHIVDVFCSTLVDVPVVVGYLKPAILLPVSLLTCLTPVQLEAILAHELAHVRRHDFLVNVLQTLAETLFFYHPAIWWISRRIREEREYCCDDLVIHLLENRIDYGRALLAVEEQRGRSPLLALSIKDGAMLTRIRRITGTPPTNVAAGWPAVLLILLTLLPGLWVNGTFAKADKETANAAGTDPAVQVPAIERITSLTANKLPRRSAVEQLAKQVGLVAQFETEALAEAGLDLNDPLTINFEDVPLSRALGEVIPWESYPGVMREVRGNTLVVTTLEAWQKRTIERLPDWLASLYNHGLIATLDESDTVASVTVSGIATDDFLAKLKTLPKLRELHVEVTTGLTPDGMAHLADIKSLEKLSLYEVNATGDFLADAAVRSLIGLPVLRELTIGECGLTDKGAKSLEELSQLTSLSIRKEGLLTDAALSSIAKLTRLKSLSLSSVIATQRLGRMTFSTTALKQLGQLGDLESLELTGFVVPMEAIASRKLRSLTVGLAPVDDRLAEAIARLKDLQHLKLPHSQLSDRGLKQIATLSQLLDLHVISESMTDAGLDSWRDHPRLEQLRLETSKIQGEGLKALATLPRLRQLDIPASPVTDQTLDALKSFPQLEELRLSAGMLTNDGIKRISDAASLTRLDLNFTPDNRITADGLQQLQALSRLKVLWLSNCQPIGGYTALKSLQQLKQLTFSQCGITDAELDLLEEALPTTNIVSLSGGFSRVPRKPRRVSQPTLDIRAAVPAATPISDDSKSTPAAVSDGLVQNDDAAKDLGTLTGQFIFDGGSVVPQDLYPKYSKIDPTQPQQPEEDGRFSGGEMVYRDFLKHKIRPHTTDPTLLIGRDGGLANVVVWVTSKNIPWTPAKETSSATIHLKDGNFTPRVAAVVAGQPLSIENLDPVQINIQLEPSKALNQSVNRLLPGNSKTPIEVVFPVAESFPSRYRSSLAVWASGILFIHSNSFVAVSRTDGTFDLPRLPVGEWEFQVWHERSGYVQYWPKGRFKLQIKPGDNSIGKIILKPESFGLKPKVAVSEQVPPKNREQIGEVLGKPVYRDEVTEETLHSRFLGAVIDKYRSDHLDEITPTVEEIKYATAAFDRLHQKRLVEEGGADKLRERMKEIEAELAKPGLSEQAEQKLESEHDRLKSRLMPPGSGFAQFMLDNWKFQKHLYDKFGGGRILWQQAGQEAFDAMRTMLETAEKNGDFKVTDPKTRAKLYDYWTRNHGVWLTNDKERIRNEFLEPEWVKPATK